MTARSLTAASWQLSGSHDANEDHDGDVWWLRMRAFLARRAARIPVAVWFVTALWGALLAAGTIVWPATYGLDESAHIDMAYAYSDSLHLYGPGERAYSAAVWRVRAYYVGQPKRVLSEGTLPARGLRPTLDELGGNATGPGNKNQMVQHPPAYYMLVGAIVRIPGVGRLAFDQQIGLMRLVSLLLMLPVPALGWAAVRLVTTEVVALAAPAVLIGVPGLLRTGSVVNNDALLVSASAVVTLLMIRVLVGDLRHRTGLGIGVALIVALLAKGFALVLPPVVLLCYLVAWRRYRTFPLLPLLLAGAGALVGGLWWLRNLVLYGVVQPAGLGRGWEVAAFGQPTYRGEFDLFLPAFLRAFFARMWSGLGIPDMPAQSPLLIWGWILVLGIGVVVALTARRRPPLTRSAAAILLLPSVLASLIVLRQSWVHYHEYQRFGGVQGRYAYLGFVGMAVVAVVGLAQLIAPEFRLRLAPSLLGAAVVTQISAFFVLTNEWFSAGASTVLGRLHQGASAMVRISPWPAPLTVLPFAAVGLLALASIFVLIHSADVPDVVVAEPDVRSSERNIRDENRPDGEAQATGASRVVVTSGAESVAARQVDTDAP